ncbi:hypothetical protein evm_011114 [Chilo suppressalis]|nr:hypothetical protein evm_011114 [Chilo suppressalis]
MLGEGYVRNLLKAGHEVTYITPILMKSESKQLRQIDVSSNLQLALENLLNIESLLKGEVDLGDTSMAMAMSDDIANHTLWNPAVQRLMMDPKEQFDVVVAEWLFTELYCGFAAVFDCPLIWSSSMDPHELVMTLIDEIQNPSYTATHKSGMEAPFTFFQRVKGLWEIFYVKYLKWSASGVANKIFNEGYGPALTMRGRLLPSLQEVSHNASLMLGNSHVSTGRPVRLPQNYIPIAGYHIEEEVKPLPEDIKKIMDEAKHGVIYFSMGSMLKSATMPDKLKKGFLKMFGELKQTIIWKFEEELPDLPKNVHMLKWAPQASILGHSKCVLFITHGGLLSTTEATKSGVPIIGIPMFADQFINIDRAVRRGFAKKVTLDYNCPNNLKTAIEDIVGDNRYRQKARELSFIFHHRPTSPAAELVHWIEHVVKTNGAPHLRSPALDVPFYQKFYLDLAAVIFMILVVLNKLISAVFRKKSEQKKQKTK